MADNATATGAFDRRSARGIVSETLELVLAHPIDDEIRREDDPEWDSLRHIEIVFALESALGVRFDAGELGDLTDIDAILDHAERRHAP